jgi:hypothetical protein
MGTNIIQLAIETGRFDLAAHALVYAILLQIQTPGVLNDEFAKPDNEYQNDRRQTG